MTSPFPPTSSPFPFPSFSPFPNPPSVPAQASQTPGGSQLPLAPPTSFATGSTAAPNANGQLFNPNFLGSGVGTGPSPLPFSIPSNPASTTPFPLTSLSFPASTSPFGGLGGPGAGANALGNGNGIGGGTPWMGGTGFTPTPNFGQNVSGLTLPGGNFDGLGGLARAEDNDEVGLMRRGLDTAGAIVDRLMVVLGEIGRMEQSLFEPVPGGGEGSEDSGAEERNGTDGAHAASGAGQGGRSEGMQVGVGGLSRIEFLHLEYIQLLSNIQNIATTTLIGALPSPLSQAVPPPPAPVPAPAQPAQSAQAHSTADGSTTVPPPHSAFTSASTSITNPAPALPGPALPNLPEGAAVAGAPETRLPTIEELTAFAERQANLEFNRREAIRVSAKTVLDVLGKR